MGTYEAVPGVPGPIEEAFLGIGRMSKMVLLLLLFEGDDADRCVVHARDP